MTLQRKSHPKLLTEQKHKNPKKVSPCNLSPSFSLAEVSSCSFLHIIAPLLVYIAVVQDTHSNGIWALLEGIDLSQLSLPLRSDGRSDRPGISYRLDCFQGEFRNSTAVPFYSVCSTLLTNSHSCRTFWLTRNLSPRQPSAINGTG